MTLPTMNRKGRRYLSTGRYAERDGVHSRTIIRRKKAGLIPPPDLTINGRFYWAEETLDNWDKAHPVRSDKEARAAAARASTSA